MRGKNMSKLKKRELERKGEKKQKILDNKLQDEHLGDLTKKELDELFDYNNYIGLSVEKTEKIVNKWRSFI